MAIDTDKPGQGSNIKTRALSHFKKKERLPFHIPSLNPNPDYSNFDGIMMQQCSSGFYR